MTLLKWANPKDPGDVLDYTIDISGVIDPDGANPNGDTIASVTWTVPTGLTKTSQVQNEGLAVIWLAGGTASRTYTLNMDAITAQGRTVNRDVQLEVAER